MEMNNGLLVHLANSPALGLDPSVDGDIFAASLQFPGNGNFMRLSLLILVLALFGVSQQASAFRLRLNGLVTEHGSQHPMASARVRIYMDGDLQRVQRTDLSGKYTFLLKNGGSYVIRVDAPGHQGKCITIDTHGMEWEGDRRVSELEVEMRLPALSAEVDLSYFDLPMGMAYFEPATGLTRWSMTYERTVMLKARELMADYDRRCAERTQSTADGRVELGEYLVLHRR